MKDRDYYREGYTDPKNKELTSLEILWCHAKLEADWIKDRIITYAEAMEHNEQLMPYFEDVKKALERLNNQDKLLDAIYREFGELLSNYAFTEKNESDDIKTVQSWLQEKRQK